MGGRRWHACASYLPTSLPDSLAKDDACSWAPAPADPVTPDLSSAGRKEGPRGPDTLQSPVLDSHPAHRCDPTSQASVQPPWVPLPVLSAVRVWREGPQTHVPRHQLYVGPPGTPTALCPVPAPLPPKGCSAHGPAPVGPPDASF